MGMLRRRGGEYYFRGLANLLTNDFPFTLLILLDRGKQGGTLFKELITHPIAVSPTHGHSHLVFGKLGIMHVLQSWVSARQSKMCSYITDFVVVLLNTALCASGESLDRARSVSMVNEHSDKRRIAFSKHTDLCNFAPALSCVSHSLESLLLDWRPRGIRAAFLTSCALWLLRLCFTGPWYRIATLAEDGAWRRG